MQTPRDGSASDRVDLDDEDEDDDGTDEPSPDGPAPTDGIDHADRPTLADLLDDLATEFADIERHDGPDGADFNVGPQLFARLNGVTAEFRLRREIASAAARTTDAGPSALGSEWIAFRPRSVDQYAIDRAQSWFELAHRLAAESGPRRPERRH